MAYLLPMRYRSLVTATSLSWKNIIQSVACVNQLILKVLEDTKCLFSTITFSVKQSDQLYYFVAGKIYDLGGQVLAANSAPTIFHLAKETASELEEMGSHKVAIIDSTTGKYQDIQVADDYVSVISLTLELQVSLWFLPWMCAMLTLKS